MKIRIVGPFIKLGQLVKKLNITETGGQAKYFVANHDIKVDDRTQLTRNSKVYVGSKVWDVDRIYYIVN